MRHGGSSIPTWVNPRPTMGELQRKFQRIICNKKRNPQTTPQKMFYTPENKQMTMENNPLKLYLLSNMVIYQCHVSFQEDRDFFITHLLISSGIFLFNLCFRWNLFNNKRFFPPQNTNFTFTEVHCRSFFVFPELLLTVEAVVAPPQSVGPHAPVPRSGGSVVEKWMETTRHHVHDLRSNNNDDIRGTPLYSIICL